MEKRRKVEQKEAIRIGIFGASGSGKTYRARELTAKSNRLIVFDGLGEFARNNTFDFFQSLEGLKKAMQKDFMRGFRYVFLPRYGYEVEELDALSRYLIGLQSGFNTGISSAKLTLLVDELDLSFPSGICQRDKRNAFGYLCKRGRHYGINLVGVSQRTAQVDIAFRANMSAVYIFRHSEPADIDTAKKLLGKEYSETLRNLKDRQYIYKTGGSVIVKK